MREVNERLITKVIEQLILNKILIYWLQNLGEISKSIKIFDKIMFLHRVT